MATTTEPCHGVIGMEVDLEANRSGKQDDPSEQAGASAEPSSLLSRMTSHAASRMTSRNLMNQPIEAEEGDLPDAERYAMAGCMARACPERYIALLVTLAIETPVTLLVGTGSSGLVDHLGLDRYTLLMAFLPLTSAISGNVGLQASTLTTRAISTKHCSRATLGKWFCTEIGAALILAVGCGFAVFVLAFLWTVLDKKKATDLGFAITIGLAQTFSISVAGVTGTLAPVLFSFVLKRDAGKWAGPLETAVQDIAGTFAVVYVAQWILLFFVRVGISPPVPA